MDSVREEELAESVDDDQGAFADVQELCPVQLDLCLNWEHLLHRTGRELEVNFFLQ